MRYWDDLDKAKATAKKLRKELKTLKASQAARKPVDKARVATSIILGLNDDGWDKLACSGARKELWLGRLFSYLEQQGIVLR